MIERWLLRCYVARYGLVKANNNLNRYNNAGF